jgi:glycerophosphoryl diester phosphodiesterase
MTRDGIPVILHDSPLDRTTVWHGRVSEKPLVALKQLDAGEGEEICTLAEVLAFVKGRAGLVLEIKEAGTEDQICRMVEESGVDKVLIVSFHPESVRAARVMLPSVSADSFILKGSRTRLIPPSRQVTILSFPGSTWSTRRWSDARKHMD